MISSIPKIGLGTRKLRGDTCIQMMHEALACGYTHIDTATIYENEETIGEALATSSVPRSSYWLTTKLWIDAFPHDACIASVEQSLRRLQTDYLDLVLLHWPHNESKYAIHHAALDALLTLQKNGKIRHIGVSNFPVALLQDAVQYTGGNIYTNQVEYHCMLQQKAVKHYCDENNIILTAYSPLAHGHIFTSTVLQKLAEKYKKTVAQIALARLFAQENVVAIPKASSRLRLEENFNAQNIILTAADIATINALPKHYRYCDYAELSPKRDA